MVIISHIRTKAIGPVALEGLCWSNQTQTEKPFPASPIYFVPVTGNQMNQMKRWKGEQGRILGPAVGFLNAATSSQRQEKMVLCCPLPSDGGEVRKAKLVLKLIDTGLENGILTLLQGT